MPRLGEACLISAIKATRSSASAARKLRGAGAAAALCNFLAALALERVGLIAEIKHASPSRGVLIDPFDPVALAQTYAANGAAAAALCTTTDSGVAHWRAASSSCVLARMLSSTVELCASVTWPSAA